LGTKLYEPVKKIDKTQIVDLKPWTPVLSAPEPPHKSASGQIISSYFTTVPCNELRLKSKAFREHAENNDAKARVWSSINKFQKKKAASSNAKFNLNMEVAPAESEIALAPKILPPTSMPTPKLSAAEK